MAEVPAAPSVCCQLLTPRTDVPVNLLPPPCTLPTTRTGHRVDTASRGVDVGVSPDMGDGARLGPEHARAQGAAALLDRMSASPRPL